MAQINPKKIPGSWSQGYVLDVHTLQSEFLGHDEFGHPIFDTKRSEIGELLYRLKYKNDASVLEEIVETTARFIRSWKLIQLDFILPTPPSKRRSNQPVMRIAKGLSESLKVPLCSDCIVKIRETAELKNVYDYHERLKLLENAFEVKSTKLKGATVLLFDDLYRSGATMNSMTALLYIPRTIIS
jgi:predicted amidophosphoribosyltransferase